VSDSSPVVVAIPLALQLPLAVLPHPAHEHQLKVLKLDHNPLDWPPRDISTFPGTADGQTLSKQEAAGA
jgi:hypothetical protein